MTYLYLNTCRFTLELGTEDKKVRCQVGNVFFLRKGKVVSRREREREREMHPFVTREEER